MCDGNGSTDLSLDRWESFLDRFDSVVADHGDRVALVVDGMPVCTYFELNRMAEWIASQLRPWVGRDTCVGLAMAKSAEFIAAVLGVWKAGAAWVPLEPQYPLSLRQRMIDECDIEVFVTAADTQYELTRASKYRIRVSTREFRMQSLDLRKDCRSVADPVLGTDDGVRSRDLAYVIYTSGTSGGPRGVAVEHAGLVNLLDAQRRAFAIDHESRCWFYYPIMFDASISDFGTALLSGAALVIESGLGIGGQHAADAWNVLRLIAERCISHADIPPSVLRLLSVEHAPACLTTIIVGGEACDIATVNRWASRVRLINVYGPTEATICSSLCRCIAGDWDRPLIGQPVPGVEYRIMDADGGRVLDGVPGELWISGPCLAREYVARPQETSKRFVVRDGTRYYRTGDSVRRETDGEYVFLGRIDRQINLNGFRIEPQEIEAVLVGYPTITGAAVVKRKLTQDAPRELLVAFVESSNVLLDAEQLKGFLTTRLPAGKLPSMVKLVEKLPRLASGKIDYQALTISPWSQDNVCDELNPEDVAVAPLEAKLLRWFHEVLRSTRCTVHEDFFEQGGDSLGAIEICLVANSYGVPLAPSVLYSHRTVRRIAAFLNGERPTKGKRSLEDRLNIPYRCETWQLGQDVAPLSESIQRTYEACQSASAIRMSKLSATNGPVYLLTGGTGFLGCRVLEQLLKVEGSRVVCLVRGSSQTDAASRLWQHLGCHRIPLSQGEKKRIDVEWGDLRQTRMGLTQPRYARLLEEIDTVVHCAANVHSLHDYRLLRGSNVESVAEVLRLMANSDRMTLFHASSLSVFAGTEGYAGVHRERDRAVDLCAVFGGYAQTKVAAELLIGECGIEPERLHLLRYGLLTADTRTGIASSGDILSLMVRGLLSLGCVPHPVPEVYFDMTPVDFAARVTCAIIERGDVGNNPFSTWHVANVARVSAESLFAYMRELYGLRQVSWDEFLDNANALRDTERAFGGAATLALARWLAPATYRDEFRSLDLFQATGARFDTYHTSKLVEAIHWGDRQSPYSMSEEELLERMVGQILQDGLPGEHDQVAR